MVAVRKLELKLLSIDGEMFEELAGRIVESSDDNSCEELDCSKIDELTSTVVTELNGTSVEFTKSEEVENVVAKLVVASCLEVKVKQSPILEQKLFKLVIFS